MHTRLARAEVSLYQGRLGQDGIDPQYQAAVARVSALGARLGSSISFVDSESLALPDGVVQQYLAAEPGLVASTASVVDRAFLSLPADCNQSK